MDDFCRLFGTQTVPNASPQSLKNPSGALSSFWRARSTTQRTHRTSGGDGVPPALSILVFMQETLVFQQSLRMAAKLFRKVSQKFHLACLRHLLEASGRPTWLPFSTNTSPLEAILPPWGVISAPFGLNLAHRGVKLILPGPFLHPSIPKLMPSWQKLGQVGSNLVPRWPQNAAKTVQNR